MLIRKAAVVILLVLFLTPQANAEYKLVPTGVLDAKQIETAVSFGYERIKEDFTFYNSSFGTVSGSTDLNTFYSTFFLRVGLGSGFEVKAGIPYVFTNKATYTYNGFGEITDDGDGGFEDFSLSGKYLVLDENKYPFSLAVGLGIKFNNANATGPISSGDSTDFKPFLSASKKIGTSFTPYVTYIASLRDNNDYRDSHCLVLGSEIKLNESVKLNPEFAVRFYTESPAWDSSKEYSFSLSASIQASRNFYLIPSIGIITGETSQYKLYPYAKYDNQKQVGGALSFNYLW